MGDLRNYSLVLELEDHYKLASHRMDKEEGQDDED